MPTRRRAAGSKGQKSGSRQIKPVNYSEGENDEEKVTSVKMIRMKKKV